jgi:hypothetical protein
MNPGALRFFGVVLRTFLPTRFMTNHDGCWLRKLARKKARKPRVGILAPPQTCAAELTALQDSQARSLLR